jgi:hypothetical protein
VKQNMGTADRVVRILIALAVAFLYFTGRISGVLAAVLGVIAVVFIITSFAARCPGYLPFGISTRKETPADRAG